MLLASCLCAEVSSSDHGQKVSQTFLSFLLPGKMCVLAVTHIPNIKNNPLYSRHCHECLNIQAVCMSPISHLIDLTATLEYILQWKSSHLIPEAARALCCRGTVWNIFINIQSRQVEFKHKWSQETWWCMLQSGENNPCVWAYHTVHNIIQATVWTQMPQSKWPVMLMTIAILVIHVNDSLQQEPLHFIYCFDWLPLAILASDLHCFQLHPLSSTR